MKGVASNMKQADEYSTFGELVSHKIRSLNTKRLRSIAQWRITNILFELETSTENEYSGTNSSTPSYIAAPSPSVSSVHNIVWDQAAVPVYTDLGNVSQDQPILLSANTNVGSEFHSNK